MFLKFVLPFGRAKFVKPSSEDSRCKAPQIDLSECIFRLAFSFGIQIADPDHADAVKGRLKPDRDALEKQRLKWQYAASEMDP